MKSAVQQAKEIESNFLAAAANNLQDAAGRLLPGSRFRHEEHDAAERVRAAMVDRRIFDRRRFTEMPHGRTLVVRGYERRWLFGRRLRSVAVATVIIDPGPLLDGQPLRPVSSAELAEQLRSATTEAKAPHLIGVCSPSGFEEEVWRGFASPPNVKVVLVAPREGGGWRIGSPGAEVDERLVKLFDPESVAQKLDRVRRAVEDRSSDLLTGAIEAGSLARELELPARIVEQGLELVAKSNPELRVSRRSGEVILFRGAAASAEEDGFMSLTGWIRNLFSREGEEAKKINVLSERRATLSSRLDRLYEDIARLEKKEAELHEEGKAASSMIAKRRLAAQISRLRKDISRCNTSAAMLSKQINIISTHIHNLELSRTGSIAEMPSGEELTEAAVKAEEMLEQLNASDDLVSGLEISMAESAMSAEEAAILAELQGEAADKEKPTRQKTDRAGTPDQEAGGRERGPAQAE